MVKRNRVEDDVMNIFWLLVYIVCVSDCVLLRSYKSIVLPLFSYDQRIFLAQVGRDYKRLFACQLNNCAERMLGISCHT